MCRLFKLSIVLAIGFWFVAAGADAFFFEGNEGRFTLWPQSPNELWLRLLVAGLLIAFGAHAQRRVNQKKEVAQQLRLAAKVFDNASDGIMITDAGNRIVEVNRSFEQLTGFTSDEIRGKSPRVLSSGKHDVEYFRSMWAALSESGHWEGEIWDRKKSGEIYPKWMSIDTICSDDGEVTHYFAIFKDITPLKETEARLAHMAHHDPLTGLANRYLLFDRLRNALSLSRRNGTSIAVMFIDLDYFKAVNDSFGHKTGDELLIRAGRRMQGCLREGDTIARTGGDEFVVMLPGLKNKSDTQSIAEKISLALKRPFSLEDNDIYISASIGIAVFPEDANSVDQLLHRADGAMYIAKQHGRACFYHSSDSSDNSGSSDTRSNRLDLT